MYQVAEYTIFKYCTVLLNPSQVVVEVKTRADLWKVVDSVDKQYFTPM